MIVKRWALTVTTYSGKATTRFWTLSGAMRAESRVKDRSHPISADVWRIA